MRVFHATKTEDNFQKILRDKKLLPGRNFAQPDKPLIHLSLDFFHQGSWALDVIGDDTNEAYILELEIDDTTQLVRDPTDEGIDYNGRWVVSEEKELPVQVVSVTHISNVQRWENGKQGYERRIQI